MWNRQPFPGLRSLLFVGCFLLVLLFGCALVAPPKQLVLGQKHTELTSLDGSCAITSNLYPGSVSLKNQQGLDPNQISLLAWNIYKGQRSGWEKDLAHFSGQSDIILLQEALLTDTLKRVFATEEMYWSLNKAFRYNGKGVGVLVASRVQALGQCGLRHSEPIIVTPKTILVSRFAIQGTKRELLVANIHGINFTTGLGSYQEQFDALTKVLQNHRGPLIVAGDFNTWSEGRMGVMEKLEQDLSLQSLRFSSEERTLVLGDPVDHILYRGLLPVAARVQPVQTSDHNPMLVTFRLSPSLLTKR